MMAEAEGIRDDDEGSFPLGTLMASTCLLRALFVPELLLLARGSVGPLRAHQVWESPDITGARGSQEQPEAANQEQPKRDQGATQRVRALSSAPTVDAIVVPYRRMREVSLVWNLTWEVHHRDPLLYCNGDLDS